MPRPEAGAVITGTVGATPAIPRSPSSFDGRSAHASQRVATPTCASLATPWPILAGELYEHRGILHDAGVRIPEGWHVHHINGDPLDNRLENLTVVRPGRHGQLHRKHDYAKAARLLPLRSHHDQDRRDSGDPSRQRQSDARRIKVSLRERGRAPTG